MKIIFTISFILLSYNILGQNNLYMVSEHFSATDCSIDKVIVTDPNGISTTTNITHMYSNLEAHNSEFNAILNSITSQGYTMVEGIFYSNNMNNCSMSQPSQFTYTWFFRELWTNTSEELEGVNSSQLNLIRVSPNPSSNIVTFTYEGEIKPTELVIYNQLGYVVFRMKDPNFFEHTINVDISQWKRGTYYACLISGNLKSESIDIYW